MASTDLDVVIIGAGASGLSALRELSSAGLNVLCLEARERAGGRILTVHDPLSPIPIELGAEFIHGRPPETWDLLRANNIVPYDCGEHAVHLKNGEQQGQDDAWLLANEVLDEMLDAAAKGPDQTFASFLEQSSHGEDAKRLAKAYVEGFNAADANVIGIASLAEDTRAANEIEGDRVFRNSVGYDSVVRALLSNFPDLPSKLRLNTVVERVEWGTKTTSIHTHSTITHKHENFRARAVVCTVPLGVLTAEPDAPGAIRFSPEPKRTLEAAGKLRFGHVVRVVLRFNEAHWEKKKGWEDIGFLLSDERFFPTWWTSLPFRTPIITGWSAGPHADHLMVEPESMIVNHALHDLSRITHVPEKKLADSLEAAYFHNWHKDPFSRGAYSYVPAGELPARAVLAEPVDGTLFFSGEATESKGHSATVHGAIASGKQVAQRILEARTTATNLPVHS